MVAIARRTARGGWVRRVVVSLGFAAAMLALYGAAVRTGAGQALDARSLGSFGWLGPWVRAGLSISRYLIPEAMVLAVPVVLVAALIRRRGKDVALTTVIAAVVILASGPVRDLVLSRPYLGDYAYVQNSYPSRHVVVMLTLTIVVVRLWPWQASARWAARVCLAATVIVAVASVSSLAHRMSDLIGAVLFVGIAAPWVAARRGRGIHPPLTRGSTVAAILAGACGVMLAATPSATVSSIGFAVVFVVGVGVAALAVMRIALGQARSRSSSGR